MCQGLLDQNSYQGSYTVVQRHVRRWKKKQASSPAIKQAFVPLAFPMGETCQFDWQPGNRHAVAENLGNGAIAK